MTVPDWLLERYLLDEVDPDERALAEADPDLPHQLAALRSSNDQVLDAYDAHQVAARALRDAAPPGAHPWSRRRWLVVPALAAAVAAVVGVRAGSDDGHRAKGGLPPELRVYRQGPGGAVERLADGDLARAGDVLQVELVGGSAVHGWVISVDGRGHVTVHTDGTIPPGAHPLPQAYVLDDAPRFEHFFVVACDEPVARSVVVEAVTVTDEQAIFDPPCGDVAGLRVRKP